MDLSTINTTTVFTQAYNPAIQNRINVLLTSALTVHAQVLLIRFDVRYPLGYIAPVDNSLFQKFIETYRRYLDRNGFKPLYLWVREQNTSVNPHYHVFFLLEAIRYMPNLNHADELWANVLGLPVGSKGLLHFCNPNGTMLRRDSKSDATSAAGYLSYLAKDYSKLPVESVRLWGSSVL